MKKMLLFALAGFFLASCSLQKQTTNTAKTLGIYGPGVIQKPVLTNLKVNPQKISSNYSAAAAQGIAYHKSQAIAKAMLENKADVIIEPAYEITASSSRVIIITTGYAANYENFRQLTGADTSLLVQVGIIDYNNGPGETPEAQPVKKKGKGALILLLLLGVAGAVVGSL
jgi:hypothetical protein